MKRKIDYSLYLVTDRDLMSAPSIEEAVERAIRGGCTLVQLREKTASSLEFFRTAQTVKAVTDRFGVPLIVNDRLDIALAIDADGVHVGQDDIPADAARRLIGPDKILGVSASCVREARDAMEAGADYLGVGAMFATGTKADAGLMPMDELSRIRREIPLPIVVIGGINSATARAFEGSGIDGFSVVSAVIGAPDIEAAARELKELFMSQRASRA
ncbi:MAG: thiamine phosphate synthase [Synergistaceae bacterium]|jgi:thiamine-phosphate pyrophosphorylase|nr:thiamine phosphate synthase [Synergistaceae bacterium]